MAQEARPAPARVASAACRPIRRMSGDRPAGGPVQAGPIARRRPTSPRSARDRRGAAARPVARTVRADRAVRRRMCRRAEPADDRGQHRDLADRSSGAATGQRAAAGINEGAQINRVDQVLVRALAMQAASAHDDTLRDLLNRNGVTFQLTPTAAKAAPAAPRRYRQPWSLRWRRQPAPRHLGRTETMRRIGIEAVVALLAIAVLLMAVLGTTQLVVQVLDTGRRTGGTAAERAGGCQGARAVGHAGDGDNPPRHRGQCRCTGRGGGDAAAGDHVAPAVRGSLIPTPSTADASVGCQGTVKRQPTPLPASHGQGGQANQRDRAVSGDFGTGP